MLPRQLELVHAALDAAGEECLRSPVATWGAGHLRTVVAERLLRAGAALLERGASSVDEKLVRLVDGDVLRADHHLLDPRHRFRGARGRRVADLRVLDPVLLALDVHARSVTAGFDRLTARALRERLASLAGGSSDALIVACDRRSYDALRVVRPGGDAEPAALAQLCATLLPPSASLHAAPSETEARIGGRGWRATLGLTPMVFGTQRVVGALWPVQRAIERSPEGRQLDAFDLSV